MTREDQQTIEQAITNGYPLRSNFCLHAGWQMFRSEFRLFAWYSILIPLVGGLLGYFGIGNILVLLFYLLVSPVLYAGLYIAADKVYRRESLAFADFFTARERAGQLIISNLIALIITGVILIPIMMVLQKAGYIEWYAEVVAAPQAPPEPPILTATESTTFFLNLIPLIYLQVGFSWAFPLILFYEVGPWKALEYSRRLVTKRWGAQFMLLLTFFSLFFAASIILSPLAAFSPGLANIASFGLFLLFPWAYCALYFGFRQALPLPEPESEDTIVY